MSCAIHYDAAMRNEELKQTFATTWSFGRRVTTCCPPTLRSFLFPILFVEPTSRLPEMQIGRRYTVGVARWLVSLRNVSCVTSATQYRCLLSGAPDIFRDSQYTTQLSRQGPLLRRVDATRLMPPFRHYNDGDVKRSGV